MTKNYTPGPWEASEVIYSAQVLSNRCDGTDAQAEANARLIAAAPVMLEALDAELERLNAIIDNAAVWGPERVANYCVQMQHEILLAMAKALGE